MKVLAINGSPRKSWNTHTLLEHAVEGARSMGATAELIHLYDLNYRGCTACFRCKTRHSRTYGRCAMSDDATGVLRRFSELEGVVIGSPIYFGSLTSQTRAFLERLLFQYMTYTEPVMSLAPRPVRVALIYTMNCDQQRAAELGYPQHFLRLEEAVLRIFKSVESSWCYDTLQFSDYSKYVADRFDPIKKAQRHANDFKLDCQRAFELGRWATGSTPLFHHVPSQAQPAARVT